MHPEENGRAITGLMTIFLRRALAPTGAQRRAKPPSDAGKTADSLWQARGFHALAALMPPQRAL